MAEHRPADLEGRRVVVVSPHLDDGVLSLGAAISSWRRAGARVEVLTVFGCDPESDVPAGGWDARGGFRTEGEAAVARREEDRLACSVIGATPVWLPFGSVDYERGGDESAVRDAVGGALAGADIALVPGFPLSHPDHGWLARALAAGVFTCRSVALYAEQPYAARERAAPHVPEWVVEWLGSQLAFVRVAPDLRGRIAKWQAVRSYRSQLPLLGVQGARNGPHALAVRPEHVAWSAA